MIPPYQTFVYLKFCLFGLTVFLHDGNILYANIGIRNTVYSIAIIDFFFKINKMSRCIGEGW